MAKPGSQGTRKKVKKTVADGIEAIVAGVGRHGCEAGKG